MLKILVNLCFVISLTFLIGCEEDGGINGNLGAAPADGNPVSESPNVKEPDNISESPKSDLKSEFNGPIQHVLYQKNGDLIFAGNFSQYGPFSVAKLLKLNPDKSVHEEFLNNLSHFSGELHGIHELEGGLVALFGNRLIINNLPEQPVVVLESNGLPLADFDSSFILGAVFNVQQDSGGHLHLVGDFQSPTSDGTPNITVINLKGQVLNSYKSIETKNINDISDEIENHLADVGPRKESISEPDPIPDEMEVVDISDNPSNGRTPASVDDRDDLADSPDDKKDMAEVDDPSDEMDEELKRTPLTNDTNDTVSPEKVKELLSIYQQSYKHWLLKRKSLQHLVQHKRSIKKRIKILKGKDKKKARQQWRKYKKLYKVKRSKLKKEVVLLKSEFRTHQKMLKKLVKKSRASLSQSGMSWKSLRKEMKQFKKNLNAKYKKYKVARG